MLENLLGTLKSEVGNQILSQTQLPAGNLDKVFSIIGDVATKEVTNQMKGGGLTQVLNLFSKQPNNAGADLIQNNIASGVVSNLTSKLGLSPEISRTIAAVAIPALINLITKKNSATPDDDPSPLNEIFPGSSKGLLAGVAKNLLGKFLKR